MTLCPGHVVPFDWNYRLPCPPVLLVLQDGARMSPPKSFSLLTGLELPPCVCVSLHIRDHSGCLLVIFPHETEQAKDLVHLHIHRAWHITRTLFKV